MREYPKLGDDSFSLLKEVYRDKTAWPGYGFAGLFVIFITIAAFKAMFG